MHFGINIIAMNKANKFWTEKLKAWTVLNPVDRLSEILFGLIMVVTFTGSISVSTTGRQEVDQLIWAALGCNFAWGLVDAIMNLMDTLITRSREMMLFDKLLDDKTSATARTTLRENMSPLLSELMENKEVDQLVDRLRKIPKPTMRNPLTIKDMYISFQIFLLMFLSTFPVAIPFLIFKDVSMALRISNGIALLLLFVSGYSLAKYAGLRPFRTAFAYTAIGFCLVSITILLGG